MLASQWLLWCYPENYGKLKSKGLVDRNGPPMGAKDSLGDSIDQDKKQ